MRPGLALVLALLVAGCQGVPSRPAGAALSDPAAIARAEAALRAREAALGLADGDCAAPAWGLVGRVALSNGRDGGSGRIEWHQGDGRSEVTLSAPVTRQSWTLATDAGGATLEGVPDGPLRDADPGRLLRAATGWDIPVAALGCWLRGARAAAAGGQGAAAVAFGGDLLPLRIEQAGWTVEFTGWTDAGDGPLPRLVSAERGEDRVRLVVDAWTPQ